MFFKKKKVTVENHNNVEKHTDMMRVNVKAIREKYSLSRIDQYDFSKDRYNRAKEMFDNVYSDVKKVCGFEFTNIEFDYHDELMWEGYKLLQTCMVSLICNEEFKVQDIEYAIKEIKTITQLEKFYTIGSIVSFSFPKWDDGYVDKHDECIDLGMVLVAKADPELLEFFMNHGYKLEYLYGINRSNFHYSNYVDGFNVYENECSVSVEFIKYLSDLGIYWSYREPEISYGSFVARSFEAYLFRYAGSAENINKYIKARLSHKAFYVNFLCDEERLDEEFEDEMLEFFSNSDFDLMWFDNSWIVYNCIKNRSEAVVNHIMAEGVNINAHDEYNLTALDRLIEDKDFIGIVKLLRLKPKLELKSEHVAFELIRAVNSAKDGSFFDMYQNVIVESFELMKEQGLDIDTVDSYENTIGFYTKKYGLDFLEGIVC